MLEHALAQKIIRSDDFAQALALALPHLACRTGVLSSPVRRWAASLALRFLLGALRPEAARRLLGYVTRMEPSMPDALGKFGPNDGGRWAEWLNLTALLEQATGVSTCDAAIWKRLNDERTDPRKLLGFLTSVEGAAFARKQGSRGAFARPVQRAAGFSRRFPAHPTLAPLSSGLQAQMESLQKQSAWRADAAESAPRQR